MPNKNDLNAHDMKDVTLAGAAHLSPEKLRDLKEKLEALMNGFSSQIDVLSKHNQVLLATQTKDLIKTAAAGVIVGHFDQGKNIPQQNFYDLGVKTAANITQLLNKNSQNLNQKKTEKFFNKSISTGVSDSGTTKTSYRK